MEKCRNCGTTDPDANVEEGLCEPCFRYMPMDELVSPGTWSTGSSDREARDNGNS